MNLEKTHGGRPFPQYLFQERSENLVFMMIADRMAQLNDFCMSAFDAMQSEERAISAEQADIESGKLRFDDEDWFYEPNGYDFMRDHWGEIGDSYLKGTHILLMACFVEMSVKALAADLQLPTSRPPTKHVRGSEIDLMLAYIRNECRIAFEEPETVKVFLTRCRELRNDFAHGRWEKFCQESRDLSLHEGFDSVAKLLRVIEDGYIARERSQPLEPDSAPMLDTSS